MMTDTPDLHQNSDREQVTNQLARRVGRVRNGTVVVDLVVAGETIVTDIRTSQSQGDAP